VTVGVGAVSPARRRLMEATRGSLLKGIEQARIGNRLGDISHAVQDHQESFDYGLVREIVGHGIGRRMHEDPAVPNFGRAGAGIRLEKGLVLALEPKETEGSWEVRVLEDGWTVVTRDGAAAAHFEHTVAITENGPEILTAVPDDAAGL
ncbi:MAG: M24 family metallopeptidase, partial [Elusimicrobiota bacterium]